MADGLELQRYLLNREIQFWVDEGRDATSNRIMDMKAGSPEENGRNSKAETLPEAVERCGMGI
jgi:hypothetical protein